MELFFRKTGEGPPLIILHGLYGSGDNWYTIGRKLAERYTVYLPDQRNHGHSPHHPEHTYAALREDLAGFIQQHDLEKPVLIGHSMGGKTILSFGLEYPGQVSRMIVVDISPCRYDPFIQPEAAMHHRMVNILQSIDPEKITSRAEADEWLQPSIPSPAVRQFLLKNLKRDEEGNFTWTLNLNALAKNLTAILEGVIDCNQTPLQLPRFPLLFIKGSRSGYIGPKELAAINTHFPWADIQTIPQASHWIHAEQPEAFLAAVKHFLNPEGFRA